ncbi:MAG: SHOCT domain-containing protein [Spirochaetales bacterium]|nr:SHOCT domain-containing protein [Spirochaetales bacterium]
MRHFGYGGFECPVFSVPGLHMIVPILLLIGLGVTLFLILRNRKGHSALGELKKRYAKGEISKEEFKSIKNDIL